MKERHSILVLLLLFPILMVGQSKFYDRIKDTSQLLSATWLLTKFDNDRGNAEYKVINNKYYRLDYLKTNKVDTIELSGLRAVELSFEINGFGEYKSRDNYLLLEKDPVQETSSCQPAPRLTIKDNKIKIEMSYMFDQDLESIETLNDSILILEGRLNGRREFKKIK